MTTKVKKEEVVEPSKDEEERSPLLKNVRRLMLASIGAVALAQDEMEDFVNRLVERGEIADKDGRKLLREIVDRRKKNATKAEDEVTKRIENILDRMSVPSKADIDTLSEKISILTKKVEELKKQS